MTVRDMPVFMNNPLLFAREHSVGALAARDTGFRPALTIQLRQSRNLLHAGRDGDIILLKLSSAHRLPHNLRTTDAAVWRR